MGEKLKIILVGATGQMGKTIAGLAESLDGVEITCGVAEATEEAFDFPVAEDFPETKIADVLIDFSTPKLLKSILDYGLSTATPLVLATTGYSKEDLEQIQEAAKSIPIIQTGNMSVGINIMETFAEKLSKLLQDFDVEIIEKHHKHKVDSPSGTAKMLFNAVNRGRAGGLHSLEGRAGFYQRRDPSEVGITSIRGGNIVGEHSVLFIGTDEVIEIKHTANSRIIFANGAIRGARFLLGQKPGLYNMHDVLGEEDGKN